MQQFSCNPDPLAGQVDPKTRLPYTREQSTAEASRLCSEHSVYCTRCLAFGDRKKAICVDNDNNDFKEPDPSPIAAAYFGICFPKHLQHLCPGCANDHLTPPDCTACTDPKQVAPTCGDNTCTNEEAPGCGVNNTQVYLGSVTGTKPKPDGVHAGSDGGQTTTATQEFPDYFKSEGGYEGCRLETVHGDCSGDFADCIAFKSPRDTAQQAIYDAAKETNRCKNQFQCDGFCQPRGWGPQEAAINGEVAGKCGE